MSWKPKGPKVSTRALAVCVGTLAFGVTGCGSEDSAKNPIPSMLGSQALASSPTSGMNRPPVISGVSVHPGRPMPGRRVQASAMVKDPDGDRTTVNYRWETAHGRRLGEGASFDTTGLTPGSRLQVVATAFDGQGESDSITKTFRLSEPSQGIGFVAIDAAGGAQPGAVLKAAVDLLNADGARAKIEFEWTVNGEIAGTAESLETGELEPGDRIVLRARLDGTDNRSRFESSRPLILARGGAPHISSEPMAGIEGGLFRYQIRAGSDEPDAELTYALLSGPDGMEVNQQSGLVQWRPTLTQRGRFEIEISATDQWGTGVAQSFVIVADAPPASPR